VKIVQGDHGSGAILDPQHPSDRARLKHMPIPNAYLVPDNCRTSLHAEIATVNTFRLVFGKCLDLSYEFVDEWTSRRW